MTFRQQLEEQGRVSGRAEGVISGRAEGRIAGAAEGRLEGQKEAKFSIAKSMLQAKRFDFKDIMQLTQLTEADLSSLVNTVR